MTMMMTRAHGRTVSGCIALLLLFSLSAYGQSRSRIPSASQIPPITSIPSFAAAKAVFETDLTLAGRGDSAAELRVARAFLNGAGVLPNPAEAFKRFQVLSQQGSAEATAWLGHCYLSGIGVEEDAERGANLIRDAAGKNDPVGLTLLSTLNPCDPAKAAELYARGVALNYPSAMERLGILYLSGSGVPRDTEQAMQLFTQAATLRDPSTELRLAKIRLQDAVPLSTEPSSDLDSIVSLLEDAASQGNTEAAVTLGGMYEVGYGVPEDHIRAFVYFREAALRGDAIGQRRLGRVFEAGLGVPADPIKALVWYTLGMYDGDGVCGDYVTRLQSRLPEDHRREAQAAADGCITEPRNCEWAAAAVVQAAPPTPTETIEAVTLPNGSQPPASLPGGPYLHGNGRIWAGLSKDGILRLVQTRSGEWGTRVQWWHAGGKLVVTGRRLDGSAPPLRARIEAASEYQAESSVLYFPTAGRWEITGSVGSTKLTFMVEAIHSAPFMGRIQGSTRPASSCAVTHPNGNPPPGSPPSPHVHGNGTIWVALSSDGKLDLQQGSDGQWATKVIWYTAVRGELKITGRRLDAKSSPLRGFSSGVGIGTWGSGIYFPTEGCWEVTGAVGDKKLTFVVETVFSTSYVP